MLYFFHHYELPLILQQAHLHQILLRNPQAHGTATIGVNTDPGATPGTSGTGTGTTSTTTGTSPGQSETRTTTSTFRRMVRGEGLDLVIQQVLARRNEGVDSATSASEEETRTLPDGQSDPPEPESDPIQDEEVWDIVREEMQPRHSDSDTQTLRDRDSGISDTSLTNDNGSLSETSFHIGSLSETERVEAEGSAV